jgi:prevent-host-death family protein
MALDRSQRIREAGVAELKNGASAVLRDVVRGERVIVTRHGRPVAVLLGIEDAAAVLLAHSEEFVRMRLDARDELASGRAWEWRWGREPGESG